jgi:hypothetical protein
MTWCNNSGDLNESSATLVWEPQISQTTGAQKTNLKKKQCLKIELSRVKTIPESAAHKVSTLKYT